MSFRDAALTTTQQQITRSVRRPTEPPRATDVAAPLARDRGVGRMLGEYYNTQFVRFRCQHFVLPYLADYDRDRMLMLLQAIEQEDQTYTRRRAARDHRHIRARADQLLDANWLDNYPHFARSI